MATNRRYPQGMKTRRFAASVAAVAPVSNLPDCVGQIPMVCLNTAVAEADGVSRFTGQMDGIFDLKVEAKDSSGVSGADANSAVAAGDILYYDATPATSTYYLSKRAGGIRFGYALETVSTGGTGTIEVQVGY